MLLSKCWSIIVLTMICFLATSCNASKQQNKAGQLTPFYGTFSGTGQELNNGEVAERDLTVTIKPWEEKGFTVDWSTAIYRDGDNKKTNMSINFYQSSRPGIFASAMRDDVFGRTVPYDPIEAETDPYIWAGLEDETLTVTALYIMDGGGYEMQVYKRSLHEIGLSLEFERMKDGERVVQISSLLKQVEP